MLSQTAGTLAKPVDLGYSERKHYKIPQPEGVTAISGLLTLDGSLTFAFTSCHRFHATAIYATGGMTLSGDDLTKIPADRLAMLRKLLPPTGVAAEFEDDSLSVGIVKLPGRNMACLFNWGETPHALFFRPPEPSHIRDYWTGEDLGRHEGLLIHMAPHSAQLLECLPARPLDIHAFERDRVLKAANRYLAEEPITVTASSSPRSAGGVHDFFSEGDYWWPDPKNPGGPYVQRDGMSNPDNFVDHRRYLMRLSVQAPALTAAWKLTHDARYAQARRPASASLVCR